MGLASDVVYSTMARVSTPITLRQKHVYPLLYLTFIHNRYAYIAWMAFGWNGWFPTYRQFLQKHPYCGRHLWAFLLMDLIGPIWDLYVYATMNDDDWLTRTADTKDTEA